MASSDPSFYLGPTLGRWTPKGWDDLIEATGGGLLDETSWVELKADLPAANPGSNLETARDLASLTLDGGLFVVGIRDDKGTAGEVVGADLAAIPDRIVQVAATRISPPLSLRPQVILDPADPQRGCVVVPIPASADAPHMVDQRYWGRSPDGKRALNDPEVRRLLAARATRNQSFEQDLVRLTETFDQVPPQVGGAGHVFLLARPVTPANSLPAELAYTWPQVTSTVTGMRYAEFEGLSGVFTRLPHADGPAATSASPHAMGMNEESFVHAVLIKDRGHIGEIHAFSGAGTYPQADEPARVSSMVLVQLCEQLLMLVDHVGRSQLQSETGWQIGLHITGLEGAVLTSRGRTRVHRYADEVFTQSLTATAAEIADDSTFLAKTLVGPLLRGLGAPEVLDQYSGPDSIGQLR